MKEADNMGEIKWKYFKIIGKVDGKSKKVGMRALTKPSILEAKELCKNCLDEVNEIKESTEDLICYYAI